jgi:hypothetical protein
MAFFFHSSIYSYTATTTAFSFHLNNTDARKPVRTLSSAHCFLSLYRSLIHHLCLIVLILLYIYYAELYDADMIYNTKESITQKWNDMCHISSIGSNTQFHVPLKIIFTCEQVSRLLTPRIGTFKSFSFFVCRFVTLEVRPKAGCLSAAVMDTSEPVVVHSIDMPATNS